MDQIIPWKNSNQSKAKVFFYSAFCIGNISCIVGEIYNILKVQLDLASHPTENDEQKEGNEVKKLSKSFQLL